jgi:1-acyl-sn-glycerol-3-phosphate acyltransferase
MLFIIAFVLLFLPISILYPTKVFCKNKLPKKKYKQGYIICANHYSNLDVVLFDVKFGRKINYMAKKELFENKFKSSIFKKLGGIPVDRSSADLIAYKKAIQVLKDKKALGIFPEGTRNKQDQAELQEIKSGAIVFASKTGTPIVPVAMLRKPKVFRKNYILVGDAFYPQGAIPTKLTKEEIEQNTTMLSNIMNGLHEQLVSKTEKRK